MGPRIQYGYVEILYGCKVSVFYVILPTQWPIDSGRRGVHRVLLQEHEPKGRTSHKPAPETMILIWLTARLGHSVDGNVMGTWQCSNRNEFILTYSTTASSSTRIKRISRVGGEEIAFESKCESETSIPRRQS